MRSTVKVVSVVGARPQFIKASVLSREIRKGHREVLVHTGQHYDREMSEAFFEELEIPPPDVQLGVGSGSHAEQTAAMLLGIERTLLIERPDWVLVYGDTNSTLAGALAASKLNIAITHVEAGLRSFNRTMPEEVNRVVVDRLSSLLLCPSEQAVENLDREGIRDGVHVVGDLMAVALASAIARISRDRRSAVKRFGLAKGGFALATIHRAHNVDDPARLTAIVSALNGLELPVIFPVHPRTRLQLQELQSEIAPHVHLIAPVGYEEMTSLLIDARIVLTDSGGLQKEAYWASVPCVTLREETEWVETVETGWNVLVGADPVAIANAVRSSVTPAEHPELYGGANTAADCVRLLEHALDIRARPVEAWRHT